MVQAKTRTKYYPLGGGLDVVTPALSILPGRALAIANFEPHYNGGYRRIDGYERFDGHPAPSAAIFVGFTVSAVIGISPGAAITGGTSGATGVIASLSGLNVAVTKVVGTFVQGESIGLVTITSIPSTFQAPDQDTEDAFLLAAQQRYREDIGQIPGSGPTLGAWQRGSTVYGIRNNVGGTASVLHKASATGWTATGISMTSTLYFDGGGAGAARPLPEEGETVTGVTSGASGILHRVILHAGSTVNNDAAGYFVLKNVGGIFLDNEDLQTGLTARALANGTQALFVFPPNGDYRFVNHNFYGGASTLRTYGVNGVGSAFEIDENNVVAPILYPSVAVTGQPDTNTPTLIEEHRNHLFLANRGGILSHSVVGDPLLLNGFLGAAEFGIGAEITGVNSVTGSVLVVTTELFTRGLFGNDISDWEMRLIGEKTGGRLHTTQKLDTVYALDDLGITSIARTDSFGDFAGSTVSQLVQPLITSFRDKTTDSCLVRGSNQYRVFFDDGSGLIMYVPNVGEDNTTTPTKQRVQYGFLQYPIPVRRIYNGSDSTGGEQTYFASDSGYVYHDQQGTSFDGEPIPAYIRLAFNNVGTPAYKKRYRRADLEISATRPLALAFVHDLAYGSAEVSSGQTNITSVDIEQLDVFAGGGFYDVSNFDEAFWDGQNIATARAELNGSAENIGFVCYHLSAIVPPFILQGITIAYDLRRLQR